MNNEYKTIKADIVTCTTEISKSNFIAYAMGVDSVEQAVQFVADIRKKHFDATHNCYAYIVDDKAKFSDDGEPQGTAGMLIFDCIKKQGLNKVCVVVTRYFGGIKLGAGGLVRAYGGACADVLQKAVKVDMRQCMIIDIATDYSLLKPLKRSLEGKCKLLDTVYDANVTLTVLILSQSYDTITDIVVQNTLGKAKITVTRQLVCQYDD